MIRKEKGRNYRKEIMFTWLCVAIVDTVGSMCVYVCVCVCVCVCV
jgi:spore maturation protein CgeB